MGGKEKTWEHDLKPNAIAKSHLSYYKAGKRAYLTCYYLSYKVVVTMLIHWPIPAVPNWVNANLSKQIRNSCHVCCLSASNYILTV